MNRILKNTFSFIILLLVIISSRLFPYETTVNSTVTASKPIFRVDKEEKEIALTFDINWAERDYLYDILDILNKYDVKATFFIMGGWVKHTEENKDKLIKIKENGHEVGNHSYIHPMFTKIDDSRIKDELIKTDNIINEAIGEKPKLFRFPSGDYNENVTNLVESLGYTCIQWDVDSVDWKETDANTEYTRVIEKVKPGSIILFHNNAKYTPNNLVKIIENLKKQGYKFVPVGQIIYKDNYYIDVNGEQKENKF